MLEQENRLRQSLEMRGTAQLASCSPASFDPVELHVLATVSVCLMAVDAPFSLTSLCFSSSLPSPPLHHMDPLDPLFASPFQYLASFLFDRHEFFFSRHFNVCLTRRMSHLRLLCGYLSHLCYITFKQLIRHHRHSAAFT